MILIKKHSFSERFRYRFDRMMAKGNVSMIRMLLLTTLAAVILITVAIHFLTPPEERDIAGSVWDVLATAVNAWMPYSDEGSVSYILLTALAAATGLLFTSILIGIIASAIEEKVTGLKEGNSLVLEQDHVVVLGFTPGEYTLIRQLIAAARGEKQCIVVAGDAPRSEIESDILENVEIPKNVRLICRSVPAGDIAAMAVCSIPDCKTVVVNYPDDASIVKAALAAYRILAESGNERVRIIANVSSEAFLLPREAAAGMGLINVSVNDVIARVIAHSCTETGISGAYADLFDIEGGCLRLLSLTAAAGKTFGETVCTMDGAVPVGVVSAGEILLNPAPETVIGEADTMICWAEEGREISFEAKGFAPADLAPDTCGGAAETHTVVIGSSPVFETLLRELPEQQNRVTAALVPPEAQKALAALAESRPDVTLSFFEGDVGDEAALGRLLADAGHVVLLSNGEEEETDVDGILRYIRICEIKKRMGLSFSVTLELRSEKNLQLIGADADTDFIVAPHIVSMFLAQLADCPEIAEVFRELLSNRGSEIHLKPMPLPVENAPVSCGALRTRLLAQRMILLGYIDEEKTVLNPALNAALSPAEIKKLIVISEN